MISEEIVNQFVKLESKIEDLINKYNLLQEENLFLKENVSELESKLEFKDEEDIKNRKESENFKVRIDNLLERISSSCKD